MTMAQIVTEYCAKRNLNEPTLDQLYELNRLGAYADGYDFKSKDNVDMWNDDFLFAVYDAIGECERDERQEDAFQAINHEWERR